jgi:uridine monophosphate synthetase
MVVRTSNPGADEMQDIETAEGEPLYVTLTRKIVEGWNQAGNVGLVAPATDPRVLADVRQAAPHVPILCPGVGAQGGDLEAAVEAGLDAEGAGHLINVSRAIMEAPDPGQAAREWRDRLEAARTSTKPDGYAKRDTRYAIRDVVIEMFKIGAIKFEPVTLKSGLVSPYYNNLRILSSYPRLLRDVAKLMADKMLDDGLKPDIVVGIAEAGIPGGYVRSAPKAHGTKRMVEGVWPEGGTAVLVDDVVSDGASKLEVVGHLEDVGLRVHDIVVLVDRNQGGPAVMARHGLSCHAVVTMDGVLDILLDAGLISQAQVDESRQFMRDAQAQ